jgi:aminoglycoside/choline kinase family phosphotransferase
MSNEIVSPVIEKFLKSRGYADYELTSIAGAGSGRKYYRIASGKQSAVLQVSASVDEDFKRFVDYAEAFNSFGLPVPKIYCVDEASCSVLQEDLGAHNLLDNIVAPGSEKKTGNVRILYPEVIDSLIKWQNISRSLFSSRSDLWLRRFDFAALKWETDYFTENYLKAHKGIQETPE